VAASTAANQTLNRNPPSRFRLLRGLNEMLYYN